MNSAYSLNLHFRKEALQVEQLLVDDLTIVIMSINYLYNIISFNSLFYEELLHSAQPGEFRL